MAINSDSVSLKISTDAKETNTNLDGIITRLDKTIGLLTKISTSNSFERKNNDIQKTRSTIEGLNTSLSSVNKTLKNIDKNSSWTGLRSLTSHLKELANTSYKWIEASAGYAENLNLLQVAFGETGKEFDRMNESFVNGLSDSFGLDESVMTRQLGYYRQIGNALKIDSEYADTLGKNLLKMQLDMSSLYNLSFERSGEVLQASMAGQTKPIRGATGADITQATLQTDLDRMGIDESISNLSRAEKVLLIYLSIQNQIVASQGDLTKTINSTANQQKIFAEQSARLARVLGDVLNPHVGKLLQIFNGVLMVVVELVEMFAKLTGFEIPTYETGNDLDWLEELDTGLGDADKKAKDLKKSLRGFDKLNVINTPSSSSGGIGGLGSGSGVMNELLSHLDEYDLRMSKLNNNATKIRDRIMEWLGFTKEINPLTGEVEWKYQGIKKTLSNVWNSFKGLSASGKVFVALGLVSTFSNLFKFGKKLTGVFGKTTGLSGIINSMITPTKNLFGTLVTGTKSSHSSLKNAITSWREQQGIIDSTTGKVAGFKGVIAGVTTALSGLALGATTFAILSDSIEDADKNGLNFANTIGIIVGQIGMIASGATIGSVFGGLGTIIGGIAGAITGVATAFFKTNEEIEKGTSKIDEYRKKLKEMYSDAEDTARSNNVLLDNSAKLTEELGKLLDANGKVKQGEEDRAKVILEQLNKALGTEYELTGNIITENGKAIESYDDMKKSINELIKVKRKQNVLDAYSSIHQENLRKIGELTSKNTDLEKKRNEALEIGNKGEAQFYETLIKANKEIKTSLEEQINAYDYASAVISSGISENSEEYKKAIQMLKENNYEFIGETLENVNKVTESTDENTQKQQTFWGRIVDKVKDVNKNVDDLSNKKTTINVDVNKENFEKNINSIKKTNIVLDALLKFKTDSSNISTSVGKLVTSFTKALPNALKNVFGLSGYAEGGFPEDGWFRASKGELIGQFDDGTSMVANNKQVVAGVREMLKDGMMDALMMANNTNKQNVNVTIVAEDNDMLNGIKFKEKQRDRQYGF